MYGIISTPRAPRILLKTLVRDKVLCLFQKISIRVTILLLFTRGQKEKKFYLLCLCRLLFFHFYCVSIFIEHKDEIYEEDLKEGWAFLGRKKVPIIFIVGYRCCCCFYSNGVYQYPAFILTVLHWHSLIH